VIGVAVNESVDDMLERVDADEEALMSNYPTPYIQAQPKLKGYSSAPLQLEGADSRHYFFHPMTPAQTAELHRRAFPVGAQPTQVPRTNNVFSIYFPGGSRQSRDTGSPFFSPAS
jgi:hypothetical protein